MGSGKTSAGRALARQAGGDFLDVDRMIEQRAGASVSEIFAARGEAAFRRLEEDMIAEVLSAGPDAGVAPVVVSLGGGAITNESVVKLLQDEPLVIWLDIDLETAFARAQNGKRPLARDEAQFAGLYRQRQDIYRRAAKITIDTRGKDVAAVTAEIQAKIEERTGGG